jgi:hypothetical protein
MTKEQFAALIHGRQYRDEMTKEEEKIAKESNLIVIFGASDDLVEFRGMVYDEIGAYEGTDFIIATPGTEIQVEDEDKYFKAKGLEPYPISEDSTTKVNRFKAVWSPDSIDASWLILTDMPCAAFDIFEDGDLYCRGVVISASDLQTTDQTVPAR